MIGNQGDIMIQFTSPKHIMIDNEVLFIHTDVQLSSERGMCIEIKIIDEEDMCIIDSTDVHMVKDGDLIINYSFLDFIALHFEVDEVSGVQWYEYIINTEYKFSKKV